jgi:acyl-CoA synthetase (AMP-forming)/AMP-acid ligase II
MKNVKRKTQKIFFLRFTFYALRPMYNIAQALPEMAKSAPFQPAVIFPAGRTKDGRAKTVQLTFFQLNQLSDQYAFGLVDTGFKRGDRVLVMVRPGVEMIAGIFALLKIGAVPIIIDPGMGRNAFLQCVGETQPTGFIAIPLGFVARNLFRAPFATLQKEVVVAERWLGKTPTLAQLQSDRTDPFPIAQTNGDDEAAIAFTSGSTGVPKGVVYTHGIFQAQIEIMKGQMGIEPGEVHLAVMYIFALFNPALGVTTVIPDMNPSKTAELNPAYLIEAIQTHGVTLSVGSPLIWRMLADYCEPRGLKLPSLKHVFMFGAAVPTQVVADFHAIMDGGKVYTPFGATEALPLTLIDETEIAALAVQTNSGAGVCVGKPLGDAQVRIIPITDEPIAEWDEGMVLPANEFGEIVFKGGVVTQTYLNRPQKTAEAKIRDKDGRMWHRMGDIGYLDSEGRVWVCGRKTHRVETAVGMVLPIQVETIFNQHPAVKRSALVGVGDASLKGQKPVLIVELEDGTRRGAEGGRGGARRGGKGEVVESLRVWGQGHELTQGIDTFLFHNDFPVDVRHNTKIQREKLAVWAEKQLT